MQPDVRELFSKGGALSLHLKGFEVRDEQQSMAEEIWSAFSQRGTALIEAGTGTGKSLAYLIPAILWAIRTSEQIIISTNTIALQEQLLTKDIPLAVKVLGSTISAVRAIGAQNYVCLKRLEEEVNSRSLFDSADDAELFEIDSFARHSVSGTKSDLQFLPRAAVWEKVNVDIHSCTNSKCPQFSKCFFFKAKREAQNASLIVVNHHLFCSDLAVRIRTNNFTEPAVLPAYKRVIFDEAHHLEEVAAVHFAKKTNKIDFLKIITDAHTIWQKAPVAIEEEFPQRRTLLTHLGSFFDTAAHFALRQNKGLLESKVRILDKHRQDAFWKDELVPRYNELHASSTAFATALQQIEERLKTKSGSDTEQLRSAISAIQARLSNTIESMSSFFSPPNPQTVYWMQTAYSEQKEIELHCCSFDIANILTESLFNKTESCVFSSATLSCNNSFSYIKSRLGINDVAIEKIYPSPFDHENNVLFGIPTDLPPPDCPTFFEKSTEAIYECVLASNGNAFVLFTSYDALKKTYEILHDRLKKKGLIPMKQGDDHRHSLIKRFKETSQSVLFATDSFWEGVDIVGDALRSVIIHKLPFHVPTDPMSQARCEHLESMGKSAFFDYSLPKAAVKLKQAFGRLIRHKEDRGSCICLDVRLEKKGYGKMLKNSLPKCLEAFVPLDELKKQMVAFYKKKR